MSERKIAILCLASLLLGAVCTVPALGTWLDSITPYNDGTEVWEGDTPFSLPLDPPATSLSGHIEWAVFAPSQPLPFSGYTRPSGQFTYVYQFCNDPGAAAISYYGVILENQAQDIGWTNDTLFGTSLVEPDPSSPPLISPPPDGAAQWFFSDLAGGTFSSGLIFSSPNTPMDFYSIIINSGDVAVGEPVPSPSPNSIPEPATIWLLVSGLGVALAAYWRRSR